MTPMRLFDSVAGRVVAFDPGPVVSIYVCGITPYDATHLGHAVTYVTYDLVHRRLLDRGHEVRLVRNITDVDDDLLARAARDGINYLDLAFGQKRQFDEDLARLGNLEPWSEPRATSAIPDVRGMVSSLLGSGHAYAVDGHVYFAREHAPDFGSISGYDEATMIETGRGRGEDPDDPRKRNRLDTPLWKPSAPGEPSWESPWGPGRPGWHVECSALAIRELGATVDLHGGGCDLVYPHHEFCAAQSLAVTGSVAARHWMHQQCVFLEGEPMSKSTGNLVFVADVLDQHEPMVLRLAAMGRHYRTEPWPWDDELLVTAQQRLARWRAAGPGSGPIDAVRAALDDDLDVTAALDLIDSAAASGGVTDCAALLGVLL